MEHCIECNNKLSFGPYEVSIGMHKITINTKFCTNCGAYSLTPKNQKEIEYWASDYKGKFAQIAPYFTEETSELINTYSKKFICTPVEFMRACTSFFLNVAVNQESFSVIKDIISSEIFKLSEGKKTKSKVDVRYSLFRKIQIYKKIYKCDYDNNVVEYAVHFCLAILSNSKVVGDTKLKEQASRSIAEIIDAA